ncbi:MAG TPA: HlyD family secretion protein [Acetobacteraceae bacterium]|jgi:multidrug resistance efflux pump|nr:HlyD family secretion protein [Acetobacteraceae bacterium]
MADTLKARAEDRPPQAKRGTGRWTPGTAARFFTQVVRFTVTAVVVGVAAFVGWRLWAYDMNAPWTRDGVVRADVVQVTTDVSGLVSEVLVHDNETVRKGQVLFRIDPKRFRLALQQAEATVASRRAEADEAAREASRFGSLNTLSVSTEQQQQRFAVAAEDAAAYQQAVADLGVARLNLVRSVVRAPVNGYITNFQMRPGDYVDAGRPVFALIDSDSFYVDGYFEETRLPHIAVGDPVRVHLLGQSQVIEGHVQSIARGITDREQVSGSDLLANVNPTFSWVRLAQRIPVRIALDHVPAGVSLVVGRTATVDVIPRNGEAGGDARNALSSD